jgi:tetratricopeptide (TPR) repeat protein
VRMEGGEGQFVSERFLGPDGRYTFDGMRGVTYRLIVTGKGFQTVTQLVQMGPMAGQCPTMYLVPMAKKGSASSASSVATTTDLAAPRKVRKEFEKGFSALESGNVQEARKHLEQAVAEDPCYARAQTALGVTLSMQHQFLAAESAFNKSIKCDGGYLEAYLQLAILLKTQKKYKECHAALEHGLRLFPNEWRLHFQLGNANNSSGDYQAAEQEFLKAQSLNPAVPPEFHLRLADVYVNLNKYDKARTEMEAYLLAAPNGTFAEPTRTRLRQMEASGAGSGPESKTDQREP